MLRNSYKCFFFLQESIYYCLSDWYKFPLEGQLNCALALFYKEDALIL